MLLKAINFWIRYIYDIFKEISLCFWDRFTFSLKGITGGEEVEIRDGDIVYQRTLTTTFALFGTNSNNIVINFLNDGNNADVGINRDVLFETSYATNIVYPTTWGTWNCSQEGETSGCEKVANGEFNWGGLYEIEFVTTRSPTQMPTTEPVLQSIIFVMKFYQKFQIWKERIIRAKQKSYDALFIRIFLTKLMRKVARENEKGSLFHFLIFSLNQDKYFNDLHRFWPPDFRYWVHFSFVFPNKIFLLRKTNKKWLKISPSRL